MKKSKKNNKGFSLVELIVVVLILGILAVAVTPQIMTWIDKSHVAKDESYAGTASAAIEAVALEYIGMGRQDEIMTTVTIWDENLTCDGASVVTTDPDEVKFEDALKAAFGGDGLSKCSDPSQNQMVCFVATITVDTTTKTVSVETKTATHS